LRCNSIALKFLWRESAVALRSAAKNADGPDFCVIAWLADRTESRRQESHQFSLCVCRGCGWRSGLRSDSFGKWWNRSTRWNPSLVELPADSLQGSCRSKQNATGPAIHFLITFIKRNFTPDLTN